MAKPTNKHDLDVTEIVVTRINRGQINCQLIGRQIGSAFGDDSHHLLVIREDLFANLLEALNRAFAASHVTAFAADSTGTTDLGWPQ